MSKVLVLLLLFLVFVFSIHTLTSINQDIGRHLRIGEIIWQTKEVPKTNLFSYTNFDFPFINHHWLGEVFLYFGSLAAGLKGLIIFKAFLVTAAFALAFFACPVRDREGPQRVFVSNGAAFNKEQILPAIIAGLISIFILIERTDVRPEIFSFLFLGWYLFALFSYQENISPSKPWRRRILWTLPVVQLLWVNIHIYFFLGPLILFLFLISRGLLIKNDRLKLIVLGILVFAANLANPNGLNGAIYPFVALNNYGYSIVENQGPFFLKAWGYPWLTTYALIIGLIFITVSFLLNIKNLRKNLFEFSLFIVSLVLAFKMIRNYPIFAMCMLPISIKNFSESEIRFENRKIFILIIILTSILIFSVTTNQIYEQARLGRKFGLDVPLGAQAAVDFVKENDLRGPIFNNFDVGSFLIWKLPEEKVFIDGRPEVYPAEFIQKVYIPMQENPEIWDKYSKEYGIKYVFWLYSDITPWSLKFINSMVKNPDWPLVYRDDSVMIFIRK